MLPVLPTFIMSVPEENQRPSQVLGKNLMKTRKGSYRDESKEELQAICRKLKLKVTGNKEELRRRINEREQEKEKASSFFKIKVPKTIPGTGGYPHNNPEPPKTPKTPKFQTPKTPITPSSRRKRETEDEGGTPSKRERLGGRNKMKQISWAAATDDGGKREEDLGEAESLQSPTKGEIGSQPNSQACSNTREELGSVVIVEEALGRPGEDKIAGRPGEDNTGRTFTF